MTGNYNQEKSNLLWEKMNQLFLPANEQMSMADLEVLKRQNPTKLMTVLDGVFLRLSMERMKQLAENQDKQVLSTEYFKHNHLSWAWKQLRMQLDCSMSEYTEAVHFSLISDKKFQTALSEADIEKAFEHLMFVARCWENEQDVLHDLASRATISSYRDAKSHDITVDDVIVENQLMDDTSEKETFDQMGVNAMDTLTINESDENVSITESDFLSSLRVLQSSAKESVVNYASFGTFRDYMHVERPIQWELEKQLQEIKDSGEHRLILLCGSVGDGKSHLLAYMREKRASLLTGVMVHNDSTESFDPNKSSLETLEYVLEQYNENNATQQSIIIAINLGVLQNFYKRERQLGQFQALCNFIDESGVFSDEAKQVDSNRFKLLNFARTQPYLLTMSGVKSSFFSKIVNKIVAPEQANPFYMAWKKDQENGVTSVAHDNYWLLQHESIKMAVVQALIEAMIKQKVFISTRSLYNFLYEIIVPAHDHIMSGQSPSIQDMLPNLLYGHPDRSLLQLAIHANDPVKKRTKQTDELLATFMLSMDVETFIQAQLQDTAHIDIWEQINKVMDKEQQVKYATLFIRQHHLLHIKGYDDDYREFLRYLYAFYHGDDDVIGGLFQLVEQVIYTWKGSPKDKYIYMDSQNTAFQMAVEIDVEPIVDERIFGSLHTETFDQLRPSIRLGYRQRDHEFYFELDFQLYVLLKKIKKGYRPNRQDNQDTLQLQAFYNEIVKTADKSKKLLLIHRDDGMMLEIKKTGRFQQAAFTVEKVN